MKNETTGDIKERVEPFRVTEEIAAAGLYLCSDDAKFTTGTSLVVDGGWIAQ